MHMKKDTLIAIGLALGIILIATLAEKSPNIDVKQEQSEMLEEKNDIHIHAGFQLYKDDQRVDFTDFTYMSVKPCGEEDHGDGKGGYSKLDDIHLHDGIGDVIHIHTANVTWGDVFASLNVDVQGIVAYVDGKELRDPLSYQVQDGESWVFTVGKTTDIEEKLVQRVSQERIEEIGLQSETCE